jgi:two-component system NtrC family sensor kinase
MAKVSNHNNALLEHTNEFLRSLILSAVDGVIAADIQGKILIFNDAASQILGYAPAEALEHLNIRDLYPDDEAREVMKKLRSSECGEEGKLKTCEVGLRTKDGEIVPISLNASVIYNKGREVATIGFFHDLREDLRIKSELETTQMQLLQAEKMASLGKLAAGVAHQLNNPLNGITLFTRIVMEEHELEKDVKKDLLRVLKDAERCRDIVKELLEFARQTRQNISPQNLNRAISRTLFLLESQAIFQNIEIEKALSPSLPKVPVDIQQIYHVFMNLVINAAEAMEGTGKLTVRSYLAQSGTGVCIEISDTGPGVPQEVIPRIFDPFFTTKGDRRGTGLGLSVAYGIVDNHHGSITVGNKPGGGASFIVELPLTQEGYEND